MSLSVEHDFVEAGAPVGRAGCMTARWVVFGETGSALALGCVARFSGIKLEHGYYWLTLWILPNLLSTVLAIGAAIHDYSRDETPAA